MAQKLAYLPQTPSQTAGPFLHIGLDPEAAGLETIPFDTIGRRTYREGAKGERITIIGTVIDGAGMVLRDCLIEIWQPDAAGRFPGQSGTDPAFHGFARTTTDFATGEFRFETIRPGPVIHSVGVAAPHITFWIAARGINTGLHTRMYLPEDDISADPLLARIEHRPRIATLLAEKNKTGYRFDIRLQGSGETVFFDI